MLFIISLINYYFDPGARISIYFIFQQISSNIHIYFRIYYIYSADLIHITY